MFVCSPASLQHEAHLLGKADRASFPLGCHRSARQLTGSAPQVVPTVKEIGRVFIEVELAIAGQPTEVQHVYVDT